MAKILSTGSLHGPVVCIQFIILIFNFAVIRAHCCFVEHSFPSTLVSIGRRVSGVSVCVCVCVCVCEGERERERERESE